MPLIQIAAPGVEPVSAAEVRAAARIDGAEFDSQIAIIIPALRLQAESRTQRRLISQTVELVLDAFPCGEIDLRLPNVQSITSVKYLDGAGVEQTLAGAAYSLEEREAAEPSWLHPAYGTTWPGTLDAANAVRVRFVVGYGDAGTDVPQDLRLWIIAHAVQALRSPEGITIGDLRPLPYVDHLLDGYIVWRAM